MRPHESYDGAEGGLGGSSVGSAAIMAFTHRLGAFGPKSSIRDGVYGAPLVAKATGLTVEQREPPPVERAAPQLRPQPTVFRAPVTLEDSAARQLQAQVRGGQSRKRWKRRIANVLRAAMAANAAFKDAGRQRRIRFEASAEFSQQVVTRHSASSRSLVGSSERELVAAAPVEQVHAPPRAASPLWSPRATGPATAAAPASSARAATLAVRARYEQRLLDSLGELADSWGSHGRDISLEDLWWDESEPIELGDETQGPSAVEDDEPLYPMQDEAPPGLLDPSQALATPPSPKPTPPALASQESGGVLVKRLPSQTPMAQPSQPPVAEPPQPPQPPVAQPSRKLTERLYKFGSFGVESSDDDPEEYDEEEAGDDEDRAAAEREAAALARYGF